MASVSIRGVRKSFGSTAILHGVDVEIADGEFCVLVGPSGCGKSTLLRMIAGLEDIDGGEVAIGGTVVNKVPPRQRDIAMVFQNYALYPHMTVRDNMAFSLKLAQGAEGRDGRAGGAGSRASWGWAGLLDRYPRQLSRRAAAACGDGPGHRAGPARCSCSTSRCPTWTPSCGCRHARRAEGPAPAAADHDRST